MQLPRPYNMLVALCASASGNNFAPAHLQHLIQKHTAAELITNVRPR